LMIATAFELAGPFIAKKIIDDHVLAIEGIWYEVEDDTHYSSVVTYQDRLYVRADHIDDNDYYVDIMKIISIKKDYIAVEYIVDFIGERSFEAGILSIGSTTYEGQKLTLSELYEFFKIEQSAIFRLLGLYVVLLLLASVFQYYQTYLLQKSSNQIVKQM